MNTRSLATYIGRGKVVVNDQDLIDDAIGENQGFLLKYAGKKQLKYGTAPKKAPDKDAEEPKNNYADQLEAQKLEAQVKKLQQEVEKLEYHNSKSKGEMIPSVLVDPLFLQHNQSILTEIGHYIDDVILLFAKKRDLAPEETAEVKKAAMERANEMVTRASKATFQSLESLLTEYVDKRGVGERD